LEALQKQLQTLNSNNSELRSKLSQLQKQEDSRDVQQRTHSALKKPTEKDKSKGYELLHVSLVALISLMLGTFM
jgi:TolA-binding protein